MRAKGVANIFLYTVVNWILLLSSPSWFFATCFVGTENAADEESRQNIAVDKETGGSYVVSEVSGELKSSFNLKFDQWTVSTCKIYKLKMFLI